MLQTRTLDSSFLDVVITSELAEEEQVTYHFGHGAWQRVRELSFDVEADNSADDWIL